VGVTVRQTKTGKAILWTVGVGIYVAGRILLLNFLKAFAFLGIAISLHFSNVVQATQIKSTLLCLLQVVFLKNSLH
jgi:hypothetical protein